MILIHDYIEHEVKAKNKKVLQDIATPHVDKHCFKVWAFQWRVMRIYWSFWRWNCSFRWTKERYV